MLTKILGLISGGSSLFKYAAIAGLAGTLISSGITMYQGQKRQVAEEKLNVANQEIQSVKAEHALTKGELLNTQEDLQQTRAESTLYQTVIKEQAKKQTRLEQLNEKITASKTKYRTIEKTIKQKEPSCAEWLNAPRLPCVDELLDHATRESDASG